jgi:hypothetical protein
MVVLLETFSFGHHASFYPLLRTFSISAHQLATGRIPRDGSLLAPAAV